MRSLTLVVLSLVCLAWGGAVHAQDGAKKAEKPKDAATQPTKKEMTPLQKGLLTAHQLQRLKKFDDAHKKLDELSKAHPKDLHEIGLKRALVFIAQEKLDDAEKVYQSLLATDSEGEIFAGLASLDAKRKDKKAQLQHLEEGLKKHPKSTSLMLQLAVHNTDLAKASELYKQVLGIEPKNKMALNNLGNQELTAGRFEEAVKYFKPYSEVAPTGSGNLNLAQAQMGLGKYADAQATFDRLVKAKKRPDPFMLHGIVLALLGQGKVAEARTTLEPALKGKKLHPVVSAAKASLLLAEGKYAEAVEPATAAVNASKRRIGFRLVHAEALRLAKKKQPNFLAGDVPAHLTVARAGLDAGLGLDLYGKGDKAAKGKAESGVKVFGTAERFAKYYGLPPQSSTDLAAAVAGKVTSNDVKTAAPVEKGNTNGAAPEKAASGCACSSVDAKSPAPAGMFLMLVGLVVVARRRFS